MEYRRLGRTGIKVSEISLGSWLTHGYGDTEQVVKSIHTAYSLGINFFDTANMYERGAAEVLLGKTLQEYPRESFVLATKAFWPMGDGPNDRGLSRKHIMEQAHASLKRLGTDYVDIFYCHRYDPDTPLEETLRALDDLVRQGKVLYVGVSEWTAVQMQDALGVADRYLLDRIVVNQPIYNMFERYIEKEVIPLGVEKGIGQVVFSPLAQGLLTGKYKSATDIPADSRAAKIDFMKRGITEEKINKVQQLSKVADELGITVGQLALAWILRQDIVASALVGASRPEQVEENVKASGIKLSEDVLARIEQILA
ncbi:aldo/keto reductase family protein [Paenibacillus sediminis]|uniref:Aryl-alcohol dehydrogenase-like predicted oxidoreductase n=1 Tax=Paenibacillus sediminis TaxID=664909 RepID=A0ABS4H2R8_9BACL|nr:aldo/keto reductase family protein [Paenibacillus sediminis]MBP1936756.1 aryl-alcohol dehydrogenase-like predicted oxidoreductase [Paenibacillus sediminis]